MLIDDGAVRSFGSALAWARGTGVGDLYVLVEDASSETPQPSGIMARRASLFRRRPQVWEVLGRSVRPVTHAPAPPTGVWPPEALLLDTRLGALADLIRACGAEPVVEHGVLVGEVLGLEVARAIPEDGRWQLVVGVGHHDREARRQMTPGLDPVEALGEVVRMVKAWRRDGVARHPANLLARERWLRAVLISRPALVGARNLAALPPPLPRRDLRRPAPAPAAGVDLAGRPVVVVCSTGVDVDLIPTAADARWHWDPTARLVLAVPEGDDYPVTRDLAAALTHPAEIVTVPGHWPALL